MTSIFSFFNLAKGTYMMRQWTPTLLILVLVIFLAGCGGSGGGSGMMPEAITDEEIHDQIAEIGKKATRIISSDLVVTASPIPLPTERFAVVCNADTCTAMLPTGPLAYNTVQGTTFSPEQHTTYAGTRQGVRLRDTSGSDAAFGVTDFRGMGGWMKYSTFSSDRSTFSTGVRWAGSASAGQHSGANPMSGSATWTGAMTGWDKLSDEDPLIGDATLSFDMARQVLDLAFTSIFTRDNGRKYDDMHWSNVPVVDGHFSQGTGQDSLSGYFYGPNQEEVSGIFERRHIVGAFGANRE